jgi:hypothetical protein
MCRNSDATEYYYQSLGSFLCRVAVIFQLRTESLKLRSSLRLPLLGSDHGKPKREVGNMKPWPAHPVIYEINTWVWLDELSRKSRKHVTLASVPASEWDGLAALKVDAVWLMGVWERSPVGRDIANRNPGLLEDFRRALPDFQSEDNVGSPYCVRRYTVDEHLGGRAGLAAARAELARRGLRLILDFVPNHVAPDHPWAAEHPEYLIRGSSEDARNDPVAFLSVGDHVFACGRDPFFPAWPDVLQLNAFDSGLRGEVVETLADIADQCDGVRCDMAMLMLNSVFERTWGARAGARPEADYWATIIPAVKAQHLEFIFAAETYWDLEWELQQQGFDYCYDKRLYDRLEKGNAESVRLHLTADMSYQRRLVRFIENHDEPRASAAFPGDRARAVAVAALTLPGARLLHEGQLEGRRVRLPVFLRRLPAEAVDERLQAFYRTLLAVIAETAFTSGEWRLCDLSGWPDNSTWRNLLAWCWRSGADFAMVVVNVSDAPAQARVRFSWGRPAGPSVSLRDVFTSSVYDRPGQEIVDPGLFVDLAAWGFHVFRFQARCDG